MKTKAEETIMIIKKNKGLCIIRDTPMQSATCRLDLKYRCNIGTLSKVIQEHAKAKGFKSTIHFGYETFEKAVPATRVCNK